jgi:hypothetical protein
MSGDDRFEQELPERLADLATAPFPDYIEGVLGITARTARRPAWLFPARWLPRLVGEPSLAGQRWLQTRAVIVLVALLLLLVAAVVAIVGSPRRLPEPFGLARNGVVAFAAHGDVQIAEPNGATRVLIEGPGEDVGLTFSRDGTKLAFIRLLDGKEYLMGADADGSEVIRLMPNGLRLPGRYVFSPDGTRIALEHVVDRRRVISIVRTDGGGFDTLDLAFSATSPDWRPPDGRELLVRDEAIPATLHVVATDGSASRSLGLAGAGLLGGQYDLLGAVWSPDGARIAYHTVDPLDGGGEAFRVHVVNADGTGDRVISGSRDDVQEGWPDWSPDGTGLVIERWEWEGDSWLAVVPADGSGPGIDTGKKTPFQANMGWSTVWAPDGSRILAFWDESVGTLVVDPATGEYETPTWQTTDRPAWQRVAP